MNVNSTAGGQAYGILSSGSNGLSGLASGMDTESMVTKMLAGQQTKIDKQKSSKQIMEWKQNTYRDITKKINVFQNKFFDITSPTSLVSNSFFNQMASKTDSKAFTVTGTSNAISGDMRLKIDQLATSTTVKGADLTSMNFLTSSFDATAFDPQVSMSIAKMHEEIVDADGNPVLDADGNKTYKTIAEGGKITLTKEHIEKLMKGEDVELELAYSSDPDAAKSKFTFSVKDGKLEVSNNDGRLIDIDAADEKTPGGSNPLGLEMLGMRNGGQFIQTQLGDDKASKFTTNKDAKVTMDITLDGNTKNFTIDRAETKTSLQAKLDHAFGKDAITLAGTEDMSNIAFETTKGRKISVGGDGTGLDAFNFKSGLSNMISTGNTLEDAFGMTESEFSLSVNGTEIKLSKDDTISSFIKKVNDSAAGVTLKYDDFKNQFTMTSDNSGKGHEIVISGDTEGLLGKAFGGALTVTAGKNAEFTFNGVKTERSTNNFTISGLNITLKDVNTDAETITTTRNDDAIVAGIKSFVDDYNALIKELNDLVGADPIHKDYPPLTDAQKKEMSESEITAWNKKAQQGLLKGDADVNSFLSSMRLALFQKPDGSSISLFDIGIDTSEKTADNGKLKIDETKLREMLSSRPEDVQNLFTYSKTKQVMGDDGKMKTVDDGTQGIATAFKSIIRKTANTSSASPGSLVAKAGAEGTATATQNVLSLEMKRATDKIKNLSLQYEQQKTRYWKQFTAMEKAVSSISAQSSWLTQFTG